MGREGRDGRETSARKLHSPFFVFKIFGRGAGAQACDWANCKRDVWGVLFPLGEIKKIISFSGIGNEAKRAVLFITLFFCFPVIIFFLCFTDIQKSLQNICP